MPRPDLSEKLGVNYRRIPLLSIGKDIYLDTRLIISKLESLYPSIPKLGASTPDQAAIERLLESFIVEGVFPSAARLIPTNLPLLKDPKFQKDRMDFTGVKLTAQQAAALRPEAVNEISRAMELLETTLLADGREWLLKTSQPTLADIEAVWPLHWVVLGMPGAVPKESVNEQKFPKVFAWIKRFDAVTRAKAKDIGKVKTVKGDEARDIILGSKYSEQEGGQVDGTNPLVNFHGLKKGSKVAVWPTDTGRSYKDVGQLVRLDEKEVVIQPEGSEVRVHAPRHGFRVGPAGEGAKI
jgi:hypothetical protein